MRTIIFLFLFSFLVGGCKKEEGQAAVAEVKFEKPAHFPEPVYKFENNPVTGAGFALGRKLFYEGDLSRDGSISCGECHQQSAAFTHHGHDLSHGIDDRLGNRNSPPVMNLAWMPTFFWDGGVHDLDLQPVAPIENPVEMDEQLSRVLEKLRQNPEYPPLFEAAFGSKEISTTTFLKALSQFMVMAVSAGSRYDKFVQGDAAALTDEEKQGLALVRNKCGTCHSGELFTDFQFRNNGLSHQYNPDEGRAHVTLNPDDQYKFKVPSLRNIAKTGPYMHDGRFYSLDEVLDHYAGGVVGQPTLDPQLIQPDGTLGISLTVQEKQQIKAFLYALTDDDFIRNPLFAQQ